MSGTFRVMNIAREVELPVDDVVSKLKELGIEVTNKFSTISDEEYGRFKEELERKARMKTKETRIGGGAVIRRKAAPAPKPAEKPAVKAPPVRSEKKATPDSGAPAVRPVRKKPVVAEIAEVRVEPAIEAPVAPVEIKTEQPVVSVEAPQVIEQPVAETITPAASIEEVVIDNQEKAENKPVIETPEATEPPVEVTIPEPVVEPVVEPVAEPVVTPPVSEVEPSVVVEKPPVVEVPVVEAIQTPAEATSEVQKPEERRDNRDRKQQQGKRITHGALPGRPEASASPVERAQARSTRQPAPQGGPKKKKEIDGPKLGPTGRYIVLPTKPVKNQGGGQNHNRSNVHDRQVYQPNQDSSSNSSSTTATNSNDTQARKGKNDRESFISYKEKYKEDELLKKAGGITKKKNKDGKPNLPPEGKRKLKIDEFMSISEMAKQMGLKATELIKKMLSLGQMVNINSTIDADTAAIVASDWGFEVENVGFQEEKMLEEVVSDDQNLELRPPIITIMGHVDHGKTSLLDVIRKSDLVSKESGGITQHIGAYKVKIPTGEIVFIDTPGHEAFSNMRARGASLTDIVILVVAADDGVMPQTVEAINHCRASNVPMIVAITKIDKNNANPQMVREKLTAHNIIDENWGGDNVIVEVSSVNKTGVDTLLEMVLLQAELMELKADSTQRARATVIEGQLDKSKGPIVNVLVNNGTLKVGDIVICGTYGGKIRSLMDDRGRSLKEAPPATPIEVTGLEGVPQPGDELISVEDEKTAKRILEKRRDEAKQKELARKAQAKGMDAIRLAIAKGEQKQLNVVLKADVQGTMEAIRETLTRQSTERVKVNVVQAGVGGINETDINLAITAEALVLGFRVRPSTKARHKAENEGIDIKQYNVIYDIVDDVKDLMRGLLPKQKSEKIVGKIEVRAVFTIPKIGTIAGCYVLEGKVNRSCMLRIYRDNVQIHEGRVSSLKRFKDDVKEVVSGYECGLGFDNYHDLKEQDIIEVYEIIEIQPELD